MEIRARMGSSETSNIGVLGEYARVGASSDLMARFLSGRFFVVTDRVRSLTIESTGSCEGCRRAAGSRKASGERAPRPPKTGRFRPPRPNSEGARTSSGGGPRPAIPRCQNHAPGLSEFAVRPLQAIDQSVARFRFDSRFTQQCTRQQACRNLPPFPHSRRCQNSGVLRQSRRVSRWTKGIPHFPSIAYPRNSQIPLYEWIVMIHPAP